MSVSRSKKVKVLEVLIPYLTQKGSIPTPSEFNKDPNRPSFVTASIIRQYFGNWGKLQNALSKYNPEAYNKIITPKPTVKPTTKAKPAPKAEKKAK